MLQARGWLPEDVAIIPAGLDLAAAVDNLDRSALSDDDLIRLAQARQRLVAHMEAQLLADLHAIGQRADKLRCKTEVDRHEWAETEIAMAMTWTHRRAGGQLVLADQLIERLPAVFQAFEAGGIDVPKAMVFADETINLDPQVARRVADQLLGQAPRLTTGQLAMRLRKLVIAADPDAARKNAKERVKDRRVEARLTWDGLAELHGHDLPHTGSPPAWNGSPRWLGRRRPPETVGRLTSCGRTRCWTCWSATAPPSVGRSPRPPSAPPIRTPSLSPNPSPSPRVPHRPLTPRPSRSPRRIPTRRPSPVLSRNQ